LSKVAKINNSLIRWETVEAIAGVALQAGKAIMGVYESHDAGAANQKTDGSPLTLADTRSNKSLSRRFLL